MGKLILDQDTVAKLLSVQQPVELCDEIGHSIGTFKPLQNRELYRQIEVPITEEELQMIEQDLRGRPLAEILADLEKNA